MAFVARTSNGIGLIPILRCQDANIAGRKGGRAVRDRQGTLMKSVLRRKANLLGDAGIGVKRLDQPSPIALGRRECGDEGRRIMAHAS